MAVAQRTLGLKCSGIAADDEALLFAVRIEIGVRYPVQVGPRDRTRLIPFAIPGRGYFLIAQPQLYRAGLRRMLERPRTCVFIGKCRGKRAEQQHACCDKRYFHGVNPASCKRMISSNEGRPFERMRCKLSMYIIVTP